MKIQLKTIMALVVAVGIPIQVGAAAPTTFNGPLTKKDVHKAEANARTKADHLQLAAFYRSQAKQIQSNLTEAEDLAAYWSQNSSMIRRTKEPNPYSAAQAHADMYRAKLERASKRADYHERLAASLHS
jgi:hypothetical protein